MTTEDATEGVYQVVRKKLRPLILELSRTASKRANAVCRMTTTTAYSVVLRSAIRKSSLTVKRV